MAALLGVWMYASVTGCVMHETYGSPGLPESDLAVVEGYWHYRVLYDEELHIASVDGEREDGKSGWPFAYSVSVPPGRHWLQLAIMRNSREIARCAFEGTFESQHRYKVQRLEHDRLLLAHASPSPFPASLSLVVTTPSGSAESVMVPAVCGKEAMCRKDTDCAPQYTCQISPDFAFGACRVQ